MIEISLIQHPNQTFPVILEGVRYDLTLKDCGNFMVIDIVRDDIVIIQGQRLLPYTPLIPYKYLANGNLIFATENNELPDWNKFGVTQQLFYLTSEEWLSIS